VRRNSNVARVFTFGIGEGASKELVAGMAKGVNDLELSPDSSRAGEGKFEMIKAGDNMDAKGGHICWACQQKFSNETAYCSIKTRADTSKIVGLQISNSQAKIQWGAHVTKQTPYIIPPLFGGSRLIVYGYLPENSGESTVAFTANSVAGTFAAETKLSLSKGLPGDVIFKLAARSMIR
jgi:hypothetical protein